MVPNLNPKLNVKSVVVLDLTEDGFATVVNGYQLTPKWKKIPKRWKPIEKKVRGLYETMGKFADTAQQRHIKSNQKKKNGWATDLVYNEIRALHKARK